MVLQTTTQDGGCYSMHRHVCSIAQEYLVEDEIGEGAHSRVVTAKHLESGEMRALKISDKHAGQGEDANEVTILSLLDHENIVKAYEVLETDSEVIIVFELMRTDLYYALYRKRRFAEAEAREVCIAVAKVLYYLHTNDIVHRDIKLENILVGRDGGYKVCDFGYAKLVSDGKNKPMGTSFYQAPEVLQAQNEGGLLGDDECKAGDMYSLGVLLFYLLCGVPPYIGKSWPPAERRRLHAAITSTPISPLDPRFPPSLSTEARALVSSLLSSDYKSRPTATSLMQNPWISQNAHISKLDETRSASMVASSSLVDCPA